MWHRRGFVISLIAAVFGGISLLIVVAGIMFIATSWYLGLSGRGESVEWDEPVSETGGASSPTRIAPRIVIRGKNIDGNCEYFLRLGVTADGYSTHARAVEEYTAECRKVVEVWTEPKSPD